MNYKAVKKIIWLAGFALLVLWFGCARTGQNQAVNDSQNQPAANVSPNQAVKKDAPVEKFERDAKLQAESDALLPLFDNMPPVPVYVNDEQIIKKGTNTEKGIAYTDCKDHRVPTIFVKKSFYTKTNRKQIVNMLKHELTHAWLCRQEIMWGHDERFYKKFRQVGGFGN
ncbi:MAG: hypothetical protein WA584_06965 [Pyrinomonadaceae bacterium]